MVTLSTKDNVNLIKQLSNGFKRFVYWNNYQTTPAEVIDNGGNIYKLLNASFESVKIVFVLAYDATDNDEEGIKNNKSHFPPKAETENYNVLTDGRNFYGQPINDLVKQFDEVKKVSIGQGDDYTTDVYLITRISKTNIN